MNIAVLLISHRHGIDVYPCISEDVAVRELIEYVKENWDLEIPEISKDLEDSELLKTYFNKVESEYYDITIQSLLE